ncbi:integrase catalytic domain-containing protein [Trichonephila clavipes]|nr:integrase catalytic domain-containing protein [Trichonephila clavipes]
MQSLHPKPPKHHGKHPVFIHPGLLEATHVFLRRDMLRRPLQQPYDGPFKVLQRKDKVFFLDINGKRVSVSIDRCKPAFFLNTEDLQLPQTKNETPATVEPNATASTPATVESDPTASTPTQPSTRSGRKVHLPTRELRNRSREREVSDEENIDNDIMSEFEAGISYQNKRYKVKFPWKPNMKTLLENNEEVARKRFLKLRSRFKNDSSLFEDYKLVVNNYLSEKIIERVPFEEENLKHNIFYLPHRAVIRTDKTTSKLRIVFDASSHAKSQLSLNDCLHTGLNFIPNLFFLLIKFRVNPIAFVADIKMAFLMIEIDESERDFTRFFWDENPGIDLENKRLDIFRMTRFYLE